MDLVQVNLQNKLCSFFWIHITEKQGRKVENSMETERQLSPVLADWGAETEKAKTDTLVQMGSERRWAMGDRRSKNQVVLMLRMNGFHCFCSRL